MWNRCNKAAKTWWLYLLASVDDRKICKEGTQTKIKLKYSVQKLIEGQTPFTWHLNAHNTRSGSAPLPRTPAV